MNKEFKQKFIWCLLFQAAISPVLSVPHLSQGVLPVLDLHSFAESGNTIYFKVWFIEQLKWFFFLSTLGSFVSPGASDHSEALFQILEVKKQYILCSFIFTLYKTLMHFLKAAQFSVLVLSVTFLEVEHFFHRVGCLFFVFWMCYNRYLSEKTCQMLFITHTVLENGETCDGLYLYGSLICHCSLLSVFLGEFQVLHISQSFRF